MSAQDQRSTTVENLFNDFNIVINADFQREDVAYKEAFTSIAYQRNMGFTRFVQFPFAGFIGDMREFNGARKVRSFPDIQNFVVENKDWDNAVQIRIKDFQRAAKLASDAGMEELDIYRKRIDAMFRQARQNYAKDMFNQIQNGTTTTLGKTFDDEPIYSTAHSTIVKTSGSQSNIVTGSGTTKANINTDISTAISRFASFVWDLTEQSPDEGLTELNQMEGVDFSNMLWVIPNELTGVFREVSQSILTAGGDTGINAGLRWITKNFSDPSDYYVMLLNEQTIRPWYRQIEMDTELDFPTLQDESSRNNRVWIWGAHQREVTCPSAWWKTIKINN